DDLGDDVAAALHLDRVADEQAQPLDEIRVVESGAADGDAANKYRREHGGGRELPAASHGNHDVLKLGDGLLRAEFVSNRPARRAAGIAEAALRCVRIDFEDDAVDFIAEFGSAGFGLLDEFEHFIHAAD